MEYSGNLYDTCALAVKFALETTKLPKLSIKSDDEGQIEIDFSDNLSDNLKLNTSNVPYVVTVCKIGHNFVIDADFKEESVAKVKVMFGFDSNANIRYCSKEGFGSLDPDTLYSIIDVIFSYFYFLFVFHFK